MAFMKKLKRKVSDLTKDQLPPTEKRKQPTLAEKVEILARQATCKISGEAFTSSALIEWHHVQERALGGEHKVDNFWAISKKAHAIVTNGTPSTSKGSSKGKIAAEKRIIAKGLDHEDVMQGKTGSKQHASFEANMAAKNKRIVPRRT